MTNSIYELLLAILTTGVVSTLLTLWAERKKRAAEREAIVTEAATLVINELQQERKELKESSEAYQKKTEAIIEALIKKVDGLESGDRETLVLLQKYHLALRITIRQLRLVTKFDPLVDPDQLDTITIEQLKEIERSMSETYYRKIIKDDD